MALWGLSSLWYPFGWDQGIFAWVGDVILQGGMPYRDAFDLKGPAAHLLFAAAQALFGQNQWGIRVFDLAGILLAAWLVARVVDRCTGAGVGHWAAALLVLWYGGLTFWNTAQPDGFSAILLCVGFLPMLTADRAPGWRLAVGAGLAVGVGIAIKPTYAAFALVPAIVLLGRRLGRTAEAVLPLSALAAATLVPVAGFLGWFASRGALDSLLEVYIEYNASTYSSGSALALGARLQGLFDYVLRGNVFPVVLPAAALGFWVMLRRDAVTAWALIVWSGLAIANVVLQNKFFEYQWPPLFAPIVILGAVGLHAVVRGSTDDEPGPATGPAGRRLGIALFYVIFLHAALHPAFEVLNWGTYVAGLRGPAEYYDTFGVPGDDYRMAEHLRDVSEPGDRLFVMAWNAELHYTTDLDSPSRFGYSLPFWMGEGTEYQTEFRAEAMRDLRAAPPDYIVVAPQAVPLVGREVELAEFPEFVSFLEAGYHEDVSFGDLTLHVRR